MKRGKARKAEGLKRRKVLRKAVKEQNPELFYDWARKRIYGEN